MTQLRSLSIAAPAFNEAEGIARCVQVWLAALAARPWLKLAEIVVCNDGSRDRTGAILDELAAVHPSVRTVHHPANRGAAQAMATALAHTRGAWVLMLDADGQFPIDCLAAFERALDEHPGAQALIGERGRKHDGCFARVGAWSTTQALNALHGTRYRDLSSACQLVRGELVRGIGIEARGLNYSVELSARLLERGVRPVRVPIAHRAREGGRSTRTLVRSTLERASFVGYLALRKALLDRGVIVAPRVEEAR